MTDLYKLLKELYESDDIEFNGDEPYFNGEARDKIIKHYAKEGDLIIGIVGENSELAANSGIDYFDCLRPLVWADVEKELTHEKTIEWQDFIEWKDRGQYKEAHESQQETSLMEGLGRSVNPNN
jgi:hypothetical protein